MLMLDVKCYKTTYYNSRIIGSLILLHCTWLYGWPVRCYTPTARCRKLVFMCPTYGSVSQPSRCLPCGSLLGVGRSRTWEQRSSVLVAALVPCWPVVKVHLGDSFARRRIREPATSDGSGFSYTHLAECRFYACLGNLTFEVSRYSRSVDVRII